MYRSPAIRRVLPAAVLAASVAAPAAAQTPFQWEVGAEYLDREISISDTFFGDEDIDVSGFGLSAQWFFEPVATDSGPLERAAFLDRASSLSFAFAQTEIDDQFADTDADAVLLGVRYQLENDWFVTGSFAQTESSSGGFETDVQSLAVGAGVYVAENTSVAFNISREDIDFAGGGSDDFTSYAFDFEHVTDLGSSEWQLAIDGTLVIPDGEFDETRFNAGITLYPSRTIGFGFDLGASLQDTGDRPTTFGIFGRWFVTEAWSVAARWDSTDFNPSFGDQEDDGFLIDTRYRF